MRFNVRVADRETGFEKTWQVECTSPEEASRLANAHGFLVSAVEPISAFPQSNRTKDSSSSQQLQKRKMPSVNNPSGIESRIDHVFAWSFGRVVVLTMAIALTIFASYKFLRPKYFRSISMGDKTTGPVVKSPDLFSLRVKLAVLEEQSRSLVPAANCQAYLVRTENAGVTDSLVTEYKETASIKTTAVAQVVLQMRDDLAELSQLKLNEEKLNADLQISGLQMERESTAVAFGNEADTDTPRTDGLNAAAALEALKEKKAKLTAEESDLETKYNQLSADVLQIANVQKPALENRLRAISTSSIASDVDGVCTLSNCPQAKYVLYVFPPIGLWYWREGVMLDGNSEVFMGPSEQTHLEPLQ
jgi:hypothetical protein